MIIFRDGETENQALWRVGEQKYNGLLDMTWEEIALEFNKHFRDDETEYYDSSAYRKRFKNFKDAQLQLFGQYTASDEQLELEKMRREIAKERQKLYATKLEYNRDLRQESRFELFYENIRDAIQTLPPPTIKPTLYSQDDDTEYLLNFGDVHFGSNFKSTNNEYSREICKSRFSLLLGCVIEYITKNEVSHLKVLNVADCVQGILRISDVQLNETSVVQCVVEISQIIAEFLNELSKYCTVEYLHISSANHGQIRPLGSKASELASEDMEKIICNYIKDMLRCNDRVEIIFNTDKEYLEFEIAGFQCIAEHGHRVKNIKNYINDKSLLHRKMYSYGFLGHTHSNQCITVGEEGHNNVEVIVSPSFVGSCPYADTLNIGSKASANMLKFTKTNGHVGTDTFILN